jgi:hypothetical protein
LQDNLVWSWVLLVPGTRANQVKISVPTPVLRIWQPKVRRKKENMELQTKKPRFVKIDLRKQWFRLSMEGKCSRTSEEILSTIPKGIKKWKTWCNCQRCCHEKWTYSELLTLRTYFQSLHHAQRNTFVLNLVSTTQSRSVYYFPLKDKKVTVCAKFFSSVLKVGTNYSADLLHNQHSLSTLSPVEVKVNMRGKWDRTLGEWNRKRDREGLEKWISEQNLQPSHYTRSNTSRMYFEDFDTVAELWQSYQKQFQLQPRAYKRTMFYKVTKDYFKSKAISIQKPRLDACPDCIKFRIILNSSIAEEERIRSMLLTLVFSQPQFKKLKKCIKLKQIIDTLR